MKSRPRAPSRPTDRSRPAGRDRSAPARGLPLRAAVLGGGRGRARRVVDGAAPPRASGPRAASGWSQRCPTGHAAPAAGCDCGVHAWHPRRSSARDVLATRATVAGIVEAQGPTEVHEDGFRAERARPYALVLTPRGNPNLIRRLAERYDAAIVEVRGPAELLAYCREHRLGLDEEVVAGLLGAGDAETLRRARRQPGPRRRAAGRRGARAGRAAGRHRPPGGSRPGRPAHTPRTHGRDSPTLRNRRRRLGY